MIFRLMVQKYKKFQYHATFVSKIYIKVIKRRFKWLGEALRLGRGVSRNSPSLTWDVREGETCFYPIVIVIPSTNCLTEELA